MLGCLVVMPRFAANFRLQHLFNLVYPPECAWCQAPCDLNERLCDGCRARFVSGYYRCHKCAAPLPQVLPNQDCARCRQAKWRFSRVVTLAPYRGDMRRAIISMKRKRFEPLRRAMADLLGQQLISEIKDSAALPLLIPVPYHWSHSFSSSANTSELLAQAIASNNGWPISQRIVRRTRKTLKQGLLSWAERKINVRHAFSVGSSKSIQDRQVWLVDDVMTSGATAAELARLLLKSGAAQVNVAVVARGTGVRESVATVAGE
ncbi:MAG: double zinc ribbon domain-containing protein [Aureliella sp.]